MNPKNILLVEDAPEWLSIYQAHLKGDSYNIDTAESVQQAFNLLERVDYDVVVTDLKMIGFGNEYGGFTILHKVKETSPATQVVVITAFGTQDIALRAMQHGAFDIVYKPPEAESLKVIVRNAIQASAELSKQYLNNGHTEKAISNGVVTKAHIQQTSNPFGIMGNSQTMRNTFEKICFAMNVDEPVLIFGEKGTGKSYIARTIHTNSPRKGKPFSKVEFSDLSNHWDSINKNIKRMSGGTFFVDNLLSVGEQEAKVLMELSDATETSNVRLITALTTPIADITLINKSLALPRPLLKRIMATVVFMPPLRFRKDGDDIAALIGNYLHRRSAETLNHKEIVISTKAMERLLALDYRNANIIELYEILERALNLAGLEDEILEEHILIKQEKNSMPIEEDEKPKYVFVSYAREDSLLVDRLQKDLEYYGVKVWRDRDMLYPGMRWKSAIRKAISDGAVFLACFSKAIENRSRTYVYEELNLAIDELRKRPRDRAWFIPLKLNQCEIPDWEIGGGETLSDIQEVSLFDNWDKSIASLVSVIKNVS